MCEFNSAENLTSFGHKTEFGNSLEEDNIHITPLDGHISMKKCLILGCDGLSAEIESRLNPSSHHLLT